MSFVGASMVPTRGEVVEIVALALQLLAKNGACSHHDLVLAVQELMKGR